MEARFTFEDFYKQLQQMKKMGPIGDLLKMVPGMGALAKQLPDPQQAERQMRTIEAIISSMTRQERQDPAILNGSRRKRIAGGSGVTVSEVNALLKQFAALQKQMKQLRPMLQGGRLPRMRM